MASPRLSVPLSYADPMGNPSLAPGIYFRLLLMEYFEGLDSERARADLARIGSGRRRARTTRALAIEDDLVRPTTRTCSHRPQRGAACSRAWGRAQRHVG